MASHRGLTSSTGYSTELKRELERRGIQSAKKEKIVAPPLIPYVSKTIQRDKVSKPIELTSRDKSIEITGEYDLSVWGYNTLWEQYYTRDPDIPLDTNWLITMNRQTIVDGWTPLICDTEIIEDTPGWIFHTSKSLDNLIYLDKDTTRNMIYFKPEREAVYRFNTGVSVTIHSLIPTFSHALPDKCGDLEGYLDTSAYALGRWVLPPYFHFIKIELASLALIKMKYIDFLNLNPLVGLLISENFTAFLDRKIDWIDVYGGTYQQVVPPPATLHQMPNLSGMRNSVFLQGSREVRVETDEVVFPIYKIDRAWTYKHDLVISGKYNLYNGPIPTELDLYTWLCSEYSWFEVSYLNKRNNELVAPLPHPNISEIM